MILNNILIIYLLYTYTLKNVIFNKVVDSRFPRLIGNTMQMYMSLVELMNSMSKLVYHITFIIRKHYYLWELKCLNRIYNNMYIIHKRNVLPDCQVNYPITNMIKEYFNTNFTLSQQLMNKGRWFSKLLYLSARR